MVKKDKAQPEPELDAEVRLSVRPRANPQAFYDWRVNQIKNLRETKKPDPYPHKFHVTQGIPKFIEEWGAEGKLANGDVAEGKPVSTERY